MVPMYLLSVRLWKDNRELGDNMIQVIHVDCDSSVVATNLHRLTGQVFRLLPAREEGEDWTKPLETLIIEITGMFNVIPDLQTGLTVLSKLEGLRQQGKDVDFALFRRTIFECCTLLSNLEQKMLAE